MNLELDGKIALVTGLSSPIGDEVVRALRTAGATVLTQRARALELVGETGDGQANVDGTPPEIFTARRAVELVERTVLEFGRLDIVVHNGCARLGGGGDLEIPEREIDQAYAECVKAALYIAHAAASQYRRVKRGVIVNIAPTAEADSWCVPWQSACTAALCQLSQALGQRLKGDGIRVNAVCPTVPSYDEFRRVSRGATLHPAPLPSIPRREDGMSAAVRAALFLASDASHYISGLVFPIEVNSGFC